MKCSVVVAGSGLGAPGLPVDCRWRAGRGPDGECGEGPEATARLAREPVGAKRSSAARRRARERPSESCQASSSARSRGPAQAGGVLEQGRERGAAGAPGRTCPPRERARSGAPNVQVRRSSGPEQQDHAGIPACEASFLHPFHCLAAYGVSCRARVTSTATPQLVAIRPRGLTAALGPPFPHPVG